MDIINNCTFVYPNKTNKGQKQKQYENNKQNIIPNSRSRKNFVVVKQLAGEPPMDGRWSWDGNATAPPKFFGESVSLKNCFNCVN